MKAELDPAIHFLRGSAGNFVYRKIRGKTILSVRPPTDKEPTDAQLANRARFTSAALYGKLAMANPTVRALYEQEAKLRDVPVFSVMVADYFNAPTIHHVDCSLYDGTLGSRISVHATDDFEVASVQVSIQDAQGTDIEAGNAALDSGLWLYTAKVNAPAGAEQVVKVTATDRPGGTAIETVAL